MPNTDPLLSFEEFRNDRVRNNFFLFFALTRENDAYFRNLYRRKRVFQACAKQHEQELERITAALENRKDHRCVDYLAILYEAYVLMHPYADSNQELFQ